MRHLIILFLFLPVCLSAQRNDLKTFGKGWYLSLTLEPKISTSFNLRPSVTALDTLPLAINSFQRLYARRADTIRLNGNESLYYYEEGLSRKASREEAIFSLLNRVSIHYRFKGGLEFSSGFYYLSYTENNSTDETTGLPQDFYYNSSVIHRREGGFSLAARYNFLKARRIQPYLGLRTTFGVERIESISTARTFPLLGEQIESEIAERFRINSILTYRLYLLAGINYQVNDRFSVGLEFFLSRYLLPSYPRALQIRYRLGRSGKERSR